jgi:hypothetical protein
MDRPLPLLGLPARNGRCGLDLRRFGTRTDCGIAARWALFSWGAAAAGILRAEPV